MTSLITRTAKSAKGKIALTLLGVLAALAAGVIAYAKAAKPDFSISASPATRTVQAGNTTSYTVKLKRLHRFKGSVTLSVKGLPPGASASWSGGRRGAAKANVIKKNVKSATLTVLTTRSTPGGTTTPTITAKSGRLKHTKKLKLIVVPVGSSAVGNSQNPPALTTFSIGATPASRPIPQSDVANYDVAIDRSGGYSGPVALTVTGLPTGASVPATSASNNSVALPVDTSNNTPTGTWPLVIRGEGTNGVVSTTGVTLVVQENLPFTISGSVSDLHPGSSAPLNATLTNPNNFAIKVDGLTVAQPTIDDTHPDCIAAENFHVRQIAPASLPITVPANGSTTLTAAGVSDADKPQVEMLNLSTSQDPCKGASLSLSYSGHAGK